MPGLVLPCGWRVVLSATVVCIAQLLQPAKTPILPLPCTVPLLVMSLPSATRPSRSTPCRPFLKCHQRGSCSSLLAAGAARLQQLQFSPSRCMKVRARCSHCLARCLSCMLPATACGGALPVKLHGACGCLCAGCCMDTREEPPIT